MIRSTLRVAEYVQGFDGYILGHEVFLYVFDAVLMVFVMVIFNVVHPSEVVTLMRGGGGFRMERVGAGAAGLGGDSGGVERVRVVCRWTMDDGEESEIGLL